MTEFILVLIAAILWAIVGYRMMVTGFKKLDAWLTFSAYGFLIARYDQS